LLVARRQRFPSAIADNDAFFFFQQSAHPNTTRSLDVFENNPTFQKLRRVIQAAADEVHLTSFGCAAACSRQFVDAHLTLT
jgi:hypothetical protein